MRLEEELQRGQMAEYLMTHPIFVESFDLIEKELMEEWKNSPSRDADGREKLWTMLKLLHRLKSNIQTVAETGKLAEMSLLQKAKQQAGKMYDTLWNG